MADLYPFLWADPVGVVLEILVAPRASACRVVGVHDGRLKIALTAPPVDGAANAALIEFLAETIDCSKRQIRLVYGAASKRKRVLLAGLAPEPVRARLDALLKRD